MSDRERPWLVPPAGQARSGAEVPSFSIIIPTYQSASSILDAVNSALTQTLPPLEVIVVDDGSTDGTDKVLAPLRSEVIYIRQENRGVAAARNVAAQRASGVFLSLLDADDVYAPTRLEALGELAQARPDLDLLMTDLLFEVDGSPAGRFCAQTPFAMADQEIEILRRCFVAEPAVRRSALLAAGGFDELLRRGEDWDLWIRLLHRGSRVGLVNRPLTRYRIRSGSLTGDRVAALWARVEVLDRAARLELSPAQRRALTAQNALNRARAMSADAKREVSLAGPQARAKAWRLARTAGVARRTRMRALAAALAPGLGRVLMRNDGAGNDDGRIKSAGAGRS